MRMSRRLGVYSKRNWVYNLFSDGTIDTTLTGGLKAYDYVPSTSGSVRQTPTLTQGDGFIKLELTGTELGSGGALFTEKPLNLTGKTTLYLDVESASSLGGYVVFGAASAKQNGYVQAAKKNVLSAAGTVSKTTFSLDISALSGSYYLYVGCYGNYNKSITFTRWWAE